MILLAFDIGGTKLAVAVADRGEFLRTGRFDRIEKCVVPEPGDPGVVLPVLVEMAERLLQGAAPSGIGISIGGPLDHTTGTVINFPHLPGWKNIPLRDMLSEQFGVRAALDNDANLGALAEHRFGAGRGVRDMVYLTLSTGIGGGVIVNGELLHGVGSGAGEVGHITVRHDGPVCPCGNRGCLEVVASGTAIARMAREQLDAQPDDGHLLRKLAGSSPATARHVFEAAAGGDELSAAIIDEAAESIAIGLGNIIHVVSPEMIVLGGGVAQAGEALLDPVRRKLKNHVFYIPIEKIRVVGAELGHDSAVIGAASLIAN